MTSKEAIECYHGLLAHLGEKIGIEGLVANEDHRCQLVFDDTLAVTIDALPSENLLWLHGSPGAAPRENASQIYRQILSSALFGRETLGVHVAIDAQSNSLILQRDLPLDGLDGEGFEASVTNFVNALEMWQKRLRHTKAHAAALGGNGAPPTNAVRA